MRIITVLFAAFITILSFSSCQKEGDTKLDPPTPRPKTYTEDLTSSTLGHVTYTYNLSYDANGRLVSMVSASSPGDKFVYQYSSTSYTMDLYHSNKLSIHETLFLNSISYVDSTFQYNDTHDSLTEKYIYNSAKQLIQVKEYNYSKSGSTLYNVTNYTYDNNGNLIKESDYSSTVTYDYYTDLQSNVSVGLAYFPLPKYLVKTTTSTAGGTTKVLHHTYTFDSSKRLTGEKVISDSGGVLIKSYTY